MYYVITCYDDPSKNEVKKEKREEHLAYVKSPKSDVEVRMAGPLHDDGGQMIGSLLIVKADSKEAAQSFYDNDPFAAAGVFKSSQIVVWNWVLGNPEANRD